MRAQAYLLVHTAPELLKRLNRIMSNYRLAQDSVTVWSQQTYEEGLPGENAHSVRSQF